VGTLFVMSSMNPEPFDGLIMLTGVSTNLTFDGQGCSLRYWNASRVSQLLRALGERYVPVTALQRVELTLSHSAGWGILRLILQNGVDPVLGVIGDEPHDSLDPYLIRFYPSQYESALRLQVLLEQAISAVAPPATPGFLLSVPPPPRTVRGVDGVAEFDGQVVKISWRQWADRAKTAGGPTRVIPLSLIEGIDRLGPLMASGYLHIKVVGCDGVNSDFRHDPNGVLLYPRTLADSVLFVAAVRVALATPPGLIIVHEDTETGSDRDFTGIAKRDAEQVGSVHAHIPDDSPHLREITLPETSAIDQDPEVADALLAAVLRWASLSGATAVTWWVTDWPEHHEKYARQGFDFVGKWRPADTGDRRVEEWQIQATLRPDPRFWQSELLDTLGDVTPRRPGWLYVLRSVGIMLLLDLTMVLIILSAPVAVSSEIRLRDQWLHVGDFSLTSVVVAAMLTAFTWPLVIAMFRSSHMFRAKTAATVLRKDPRSPVLYLRSFQDDKSTRKATRIGSLTTEEQAVAAIAASIGPFVSLGRADRTLGAARAEVADADWRPAVIWLLAHAGLVVLRCGTGESLFWEFEQAVKILRPEQLIVLVPADENTYRQFRDKADKIMQHPLPQLSIRRRAGEQLAAAIRFSRNWRSREIPLHQSLLLCLVLTQETRLALKLHPVLRQFNRSKLVFLDFWWRRLATFAVLVAFSYEVLLIVSGIG
jgi:hypothetical protein